eukprot:1181483-Prorocentrum_minimum.AAC.4
MSSRGFTRPRLHNYVRYYLLSPLRSGEKGSTRTYTICKRFLGELNFQVIKRLIKVLMVIVNSTVAVSRLTGE